MKRRTGSLAMALTLIAHPIGAIAMPVFDAAAYAQALNQLKAWKQQLEQMTAQLKQMRAQQDAMTGSRGLGNIMSNPDIRAVVPGDPGQAFDAIRSAGSNALTGRAAAIRRAAKIYDCENRKGQDLRTCQAFLNTGAQVEALQQNAIIRLNQRIDQINGLQGQINATSDPKSIAELTARLVAETAQVANDGNRMVAMRALADAAEHATRQALKERELLRLSRKGDGSDTFVYKPYTAR